MKDLDRESSAVNRGCASQGQSCEAMLRLAGRLGTEPRCERIPYLLVSELRALVEAEIIAFFPDRGEYRQCPAAIGREAMPCAWTGREPSGTDLDDLRSPALYAPPDPGGGQQGWLDDLRARGAASVLVLPLATAIRRLGLIAIGRARPGAFPDSEVAFLRALVEHAALAVDDRLNFTTSIDVRTRLEREQARLRLILDLNNSIVSNLELGSLLPAISPGIRRVMDVDVVGLVLPGPAAGQLRLYALDLPGSQGIIRENVLSPLNGSVMGRVFRSATPWAGSLSELNSRESDLRMGLGERVRTLCLLPLVRRQSVLGVLSLARLEERPFSGEDSGLLEQIAGQVAIAIDNALAYRQITELTDRLTQEKLYFEDEIRSEMNFEEIVGTSGVLRSVLRQIETVAPTDSTVLIHGETGSGKELIARAVHNLSRRRANAFVKLNCAAIPTGLIESELFGHERGAFTGAVQQRIGRFELASDGTIFLDEIGEIPMEIQPKLLRILQEREFERLGGSRTLRTNARLITATNRDLEAMVADRSFRPDLFYRLNVFPIRVPPLRERTEDIALLARHFAAFFARSMNRHIEAVSAESLQAMTRYSWPGNIRELQNVVERAVILCRGPVLTIPPSDLRAKGGERADPAGATLEEVERRHILSVLEQTNWILSGPNGAAARLGIKRPTLQFRLRKLGISRPRPGTGPLLRG